MDKKQKVTLREKGKDRRRQRIISATISLLANSKDPVVTIPAIAETAQVSIATLYNLIGGLDTILQLAIQQAFCELSPPETDHALSAFEQLGQITDNTYQLLRKKPDYYHHFLNRLKPLNQASPIVSALYQQSDAINLLLQGAIAEDLLLSNCDTSLLAQQFVTVQVSSHQHWLFEKNSLDISHLTVRYHFAFLLKAWSTPATAEVLQDDILLLQKAISRLKAQAATTEK